LFKRFDTCRQAGRSSICSRGSFFSAMSPARDVAYLGVLFKRFNKFNMFKRIVKEKVQF
jgi:hypothetical protein